MLDETINTSEVVDGVKGHVTVELFDAKTGELVEKQEQDNFIAEWAKVYFRYQQRLNFKNQISVLGGASVDTDYSPAYSPFEFIALTDSVAATNPATERDLRGKLIGWSSKTTYSGSDVLRGSPNATLSTTSPTTTKWVFDWPTHAALGTIGSVAWMTSRTEGSTSGITAPSPVNNHVSIIDLRLPSFGDRPIAYASSSLIFAGTSTTVTKYDAALASTGSFTTISVSGIAWDSANSKLWVISGSQIASYNQSGALIDGPTSITARSYRGLTFNGTSLWTTVGGQVYEISTAGADISNFNGTFVTTSPSGLHDIAWDPTSNTLLLMSSSQTFGGGYYRSEFYIRRYNTTGGVVAVDIICQPIYQHSTMNGGTYYFGVATVPYFDVIGEDTILVKAYNGNNTTGYSNYPISQLLWTLRLDGMGSRALLPTPITKTDQQTLRITYQMDYS